MIMAVNFKKKNFIGEAYLNDVRVSSTFMRLVVLGVSQENFIHISACILEELVARVEDN